MTSRAVTHQQPAGLRREEEFLDQGARASGKEPEERPPGHAQEPLVDSFHLNALDPLVGPRSAETDPPKMPRSTASNSSLLNSRPYVARYDARPEIGPPGHRRPHSLPCPVDPHLTVRPIPDLPCPVADAAG